MHSISSKIVTSEGKETGEKERARRRERRRREKRKEKKQKTMVALFVSLKVLRADPMNVHVGSNKSGDWYYMVQNSLGTAAWGISCALITPGSHNPG